MTDRLSANFPCVTHFVQTTHQVSCESVKIPMDFYHFRPLIYVSFSIYTPKTRDFKIEIFTDRGYLEEVDFETFSKSDFRAVKVKACEAVKKLLQFTLNDGIGEDRTILSGIYAYYEHIDCYHKPATKSNDENRNIVKNMICFEWQVAFIWRNAVV